MKFKGIIFDLDDTLLDTSRVLIPIADTPAFVERIQRPLPLLPGARENLKFLFEKYPLFLVTMGNIHYQQAKIKNLGIAEFFKEVFFAETSKNQTKREYFSQIKATHQFGQNEFLSIGNRRSSDIRDAKLEGAMTCLFKYGEHTEEGIVTAADKSDFEISHHSELISVCRL